MKIPFSRSVSSLDGGHLPYKFLSTSTQEQQLNSGMLKEQKMFKNVICAAPPTPEPPTDLPAGQVN